MFQTLTFVVLLSILAVVAARRRAPASEEYASPFDSSSSDSRDKEDPSISTQNIFGFDDRIPMERTTYPWSAIGKLSTGCTGTLVGRSLVLTAAHCIFDSKTGSMFKQPIYFYANMINGATNHQAKVTNVWYGTKDPNHHRERDWALLRLDKSLGNPQGWLGVQEIPIGTMKRTNGILVGYSGDYRKGQTAGIHMNCKIIEEISPGMFLHDCDNTRGASGGPIFAYWNNQPYVYALNVAEYRGGGDTSLQVPGFTRDRANVAIWSSELQKKILELQNS